MLRLRPIVDFFTVGIWSGRLDDQAPFRAFLLRHLRIIVLAVRGFVEDRCPVHASALTFYSLLSLGPVVALIFGLAKGFGLQKHLETQIISKIPAQEEVLSQILAYARLLLENTQGGVIAGVGITLLIWSVMRVLNHIEGSLNDIWQIARSRAWRRRLTNYLAFIVIAPLLLLIYTSVPAFISAQVQLIAQKIALVHKIGPAVTLLLKLFPYLLIWGVFTFIYIVIPNTRVRFGAGLTGGIVAGSIYLAVQWLYIDFQIGVARYNPIYGSLAALPLLLVWLNLGWFIILFGAEYAHAYQSVSAYAYGPQFADLGPYARKLFSLRMLQVIARRFTDGRPPLSAAEMSREMEIPTRITEGLLRDLVDSGLVARMRSEPSDEPVYPPAGDIGRWTLAHVVEALEKRGAADPAQFPKTAQLAALEAALEGIRKEVEASPANVLLRDV